MGNENITHEQVVILNLPIVLQAENDPAAASLDIID
jgi:hypothetical protein